MKNFIVFFLGIIFVVSFYFSYIPAAHAVTATNFPSANEIVTTGWTNPNNAHTDDGVNYATAAPGKNATIDTRWKSFGLDSIPAGASIQSVKIMAEYKVSTISSVAHLHAQATVSGTDCPSTADEHQSEPTSDTVATFDITSCRSWTETDLEDANFKVRIGAHRGNSNTAVTFSLDYVKVEVVYGTLSVDMVDGSGNSVSSPSVAFSSKNFSFDALTSTGTLGTASEKIRVSNTTSTATWTLSIAATSGGTALFTSGGNSYDYNDASGSSDGSDLDSVGGQLAVDPSVGTVVAVSPCSSTAGITKGSSASFQETAPVVSSITLLTASASASTNCTWDFTGVSLSQGIPAAQISGTYTISFTLTIT